MQTALHCTPMLLLRLVLQLLSGAACASVVFQDCGSAYSLEEVKISGCGMSLPCYITLGEDTPVSVHFYADFASFKLDQDVVININYVNLETEVTPEPCAMAVCPVETDCVTSFTSVMSVPRNMALNQRGWLRWRVYNERGLLVLCYSVLVQTQSRLQRLLRESLGVSLDHFGGLAEDLANIQHSGPGRLGTTATAGANNNFKNNDYGPITDKGHDTRQTTSVIYGLDSPRV